MARFTLRDCPTYFSPLTGFMKRGQSVDLPLLALHCLPLYFDVQPLPRFAHKAVGLKMTGGGLGDKVYLLPCLYFSTLSLGVSPHDEPLYRVLPPSRTHPATDSDFELSSALDHQGPELTDQFASLLGLNNLPFKLPILCTTEEEKLSTLNSLPDRFLIFSPHASRKERSLPSQLASSLPSLLEQACGLPVLTIPRTKSLAWLPIIERADLALTVATSTLPVAGAFQVPIIPLGATWTKNRTSYFVEVHHPDRDDPSSYISGAQLALSHRLCCWCGELRAQRFVSHNQHLLRCSRCNTVRQDVKLTSLGLRRFYASFYDKGWRQVVENETPYNKRRAHDDKVFSLRLDQWRRWLPKSPSSWLEVGSAGPSLKTLLQAQGHRVTTLGPGDPSNDHSFVEDLPSDQLFDLMVATDVLEHLNLCEELPLLLSHLKFGGLFIVEIPLAFEQPKHFRRLQHLFYFTEQTLLDMLRVYGLETLSVFKPIQGKLTVIARKRKRKEEK